MEQELILEIFSRVRIYVGVLLMEKTNFDKCFIFNVNVHQTILYVKFKAVLVNLIMECFMRHA